MPTAGTSTLSQWRMVDTGGLIASRRSIRATTVGQVTVIKLAASRAGPAGSPAKTIRTSPTPVQVTNTPKIPSLRSTIDTSRHSGDRRLNPPSKRMNPIDSATSAGSAGPSRSGRIQARPNGPSNHPAPISRMTVGTPILRENTTRRPPIPSARPTDWTISCDGSI